MRASLIFRGIQVNRIRRVCREYIVQKKWYVSSDASYYIGVFRCRISLISYRIYKPTNVRVRVFLSNPGKIGEGCALFNARTNDNIGLIIIGFGPDIVFVIELTYCFSLINYMRC